jgi:Flp pilus assembly CpaE family ATPase
VYVLSQTGRLDDIDAELPQRMPALLSVLTENFDYVVIDGIRDFGDHALAAMDIADRIALVLTQDVQAVRRASRVMQLMRRLGYSEKKVQVIVNRQSGKAPVAETEIERVLGNEICATVRNDYARLRSALDDGALLQDVARGAAVTRDVETATRAVFGETRAREPIAEKEGFFARLAAVFGGGK